MGAILLPEGQCIFSGCEGCGRRGTGPSHDCPELAQGLDSRVLRSCPLRAGPRVGPALFRASEAV